MALLAAAVLAAASPAVAGDAAAGRIVLDGDLSDWNARDSVYRDRQGDGGEPGVDLRLLSIAHDERYLYLRLELAAELALQRDNPLALFLDLDGDAATGRRVHGLGAEIEWRFGERRGLLWRHGTSSPLTHEQLGLVTCPTFSAARFEMALARDSLPGGLRSTVRLALAAGEGGDVLPDEPGGILYSLDAAPPPAVEPLPLAKLDARHLRVVSYSTNDRLFDPAKRPAFARILRALAPDLLLLQEIRSNTSRDVAEELLPVVGSSLTGRWHHARVGGEATVVLSPFAILDQRALGDSGAFLLDARPVYGTELLLVALSAPCCYRDRERQEELDMILAFVRDAETPGGSIDVAPGTPMLLVGDANLVGDARQRRTLVEGAIVDEARFGPSFAPDWDGTAFADLTPRHTHRNLTFTWYGEDYSPGRLDYVVYSDSVVSVGNSFVLFTPDMDDETLARNGLERDDVLTASDHLPVVADFVIADRSAASRNP